MPRSRWVFALVLVLVSSGLPYSATSVGAASEPGSAEPASASSVAATSTSRTLVHDELGRLEAVIDPAQGVAIYRYDPVGNIIAIERPDPAVVSIIEVTPDRGVPGDQITIQGTGFGGDRAAVSVAIGGTSAAVTSATADTIVATIPDGAASGPVAVTVAAGSATSDEAFAVGAWAPAIDAVSPAIAKAGDRVIVTGERLGDDRLTTDVAVADTHALVDLASSGAVAFEVPPLTGSGPVSVSTLDGIAEGPDLAVVPDPYTPYQVARAARLDPGSSGDFTVPTGRIALVLSDVGLGRHLVLTSTSGLGTVQPQVYDGRGTLQALAVGPGAQWTSGALPTDGTVTTILDNSFGAADATFDLSVGVTDDVALTAVIDGPVVPLTLDQPGQVGRVSFDGRGGESITVTIAAPTGNAQVQVKDPLGSVIATNAVNAAPASVALIATGVGLTVDGRYTVIVASFPGGAGDFPVQVASATPPQSLSLSADGTRLDVPIASVDAKALVTADATAGQRLAFRLEVPDDSGCLQFRSVDAAGVELLAGGMCGGQAQFLDPVTVTADGPVVTTVEGQGGGTGTLGVQSWSVTDLDQSVTLDGVPVTLPLETPGQAATLRFDGRAGDVLHLSGTNPAGPNVATLLRGPDGFLLATVTLGDPDVATDLPPLPADGPYTLTIDPFGEAVGTLELSITAAPGSGLGHSGMGFLSGLAAKTPDTEAGSDAGVASEAVAGCPASAHPVDATTALPVRWHPDDTEQWVPGSAALTGSWVTGRAASPWERVPLPVAPAGVTALSGRVLRLDGLPLADVRISVGIVPPAPIRAAASCSRMSLTASRKSCSTAPRPGERGIDTARSRSAQWSAST